MRVTQSTDQMIIRVPAGSSTGQPTAGPRGRAHAAIGYGRLMPHTKLLAKGNPAVVAPDQSELAQLDLSSYRAIRLSVGNWVGSPAPAIIAVSHVDQPDTPNANLITGLDSFALAPGESASKVYEVPGEVVVFLASLAGPPVSGINVDFTINGRTD